MLSKKHVVYSGLRMMLCLLLCLIVPHPAHAEMIAETPTEAPTVLTEESADVVQEEGTQLGTGPVLMVTDYSVIEGETVPGSSFVLQMNIANLSEYAAAYNVLATLTIENVSVSLQETVTNQRYFHEIPPMQTVSVHYPLEVYSYCAEENMILSMTMTCYDAAAVHYDFQTMMTPSVDVERTLQVGSLTVPQFVHRNSSMIISATLTNVEPVPLDNVRMHVVTQYGEEITEVGQLLNGQSKTIDCIYRFPEQKTENVQVYFTYENLSGHQYATDPQNFEVVVYDPAAENGFAASGGLSAREILDSLVQGTVIPFTDVELPIPVFVLILVGCAGYGVILYCVLRKKRK